MPNTCVIILLETKCHILMRVLLLLIWSGWDEMKFKRHRHNRHNGSILMDFVISTPTVFPQVILVVKYKRSGKTQLSCSYLVHLVIWTKK